MTRTFSPTRWSHFGWQFGLGGLALLLGLSLSWNAFVRAATPPAGTLSDLGSTQVNWSGSTLASSPLFEPVTCAAAQNCDVFNLTINVSAAYRTANPNFVVLVRIDWQNSANDYDLFIDQGGQPVDDSANGFTTFEEVLLRQPADGVYQVYAHSFATVPGTAYTGKATLLTQQPPVPFRTGTYSRDPDGKFGPQMFQFTPDLRLIGSQGGASGQNVEPDIKINRFGTIYVSAIQGVPAGVDFWRSRDAGQTFQFQGQPDGAQTPEIAEARRAGLGGGDNDISIGAPFVLLDVPGVGKVDSTGRVTVSSLWLGSSTMAGSIDEGDNFVTSQLPVAVHDRQWNTSVGTSRVYATARQLGLLLVGTTSLFVVQSDDGGLTWPKGTFITVLFTTEEKERLQGNMVAHPQPGEDPADSTIYNVYSGRFRDELWVAKCPAPCELPPLSTDGTINPNAPKSFIVRRAFRAPQGSTVDNVFPVIAVDHGGGVHVAFSDKRSVFLISSPDGGQTWLDPVQVNNPADAETATSLFPWIFAGDSGRVGIMWYGTDRVGNSDNQAQFAGAEWKIFYALTTNAFAAQPSFRYVVASGWSAGTDQQMRGVVHVGSICTQGLACDTAMPPGNRNLAEYSSIIGDPAGFANIAYAGDVNTPNGLGRTHFTRQIAGDGVISGPFVTGGGQIDPDGRDINFGFVVHRNLGGHLNYLDKTARMHLRAYGFTSATQSGNQVTFKGAGTLQDGSGVNFTVVVTDRGEPGRNSDDFSISFSNGYSASGLLRGGNIKIH